MRLLENPEYRETPGSSSSAAEPPKGKKGRPTEKEQGDVVNFMSIGMSTTLNTYNVAELEQQLQLRGLDFDQGMDKRDMVDLLRAYDKEIIAKEAGVIISKEFDKGGASQRSKVVDALKARGVKGLN